MPYIRLPNTDISRIKALRKAIEMASNKDFRSVAISMKSLSEAKSIVEKFEELNLNYQDRFDIQVKANIVFQDKVKKAQIYISHFIQVLYMSVIRSEIKIDSLSHYGLENLNLTLPDLNSNDKISEWGEKIIKGEAKRIQEKGTPIYNPSIAKVNVMYSIFKEAYQIQKIHQRSTNRAIEEVDKYRIEVDKIISNIWNEVDTYNSLHYPENKLEKNKEYGIIYYYRKGEKIVLNEDN